MAGNYVLEMTKMQKNQSTNFSLPSNSLLAQQQLFYLNALKQGGHVMTVLANGKQVLIQKKSFSEMAVVSPVKVAKSDNVSKVNLTGGKPNKKSLFHDG